MKYIIDNNCEKGGFDKTYRKHSILIGIGILGLLLCSSPSMISTNTDATTLEITDISGGFGGVSVTVQNTGVYTANQLVITATIQGGLLNMVDIAHSCQGCDQCGSSLEPQGLKTENSRESKIAMGIGQVHITVTTYALNAQEVSEERDGFVIGPIVIIN